MDFLGNPEIRRSATIIAVLSLIFCTVAYFIGISTLIYTATVCICLNLLYFSFTYARYKKIRQLGRQIDDILYGKLDFNLQSYAEGELAILQSEIYKMTVRLREQADILKKDKIYLADSIADISHQIRTPLTSINLITSFLSEDSLDDKKRLAYTKELSTLLSRIDWLINSLLKISKIDAGAIKFKSETVKVHELISRAATPIAIPMDLRNQQLIVNCDENAVYKGDIAWSTEALENILKNCMEHNSDGGTLTVTSKNTPIFCEIKVTDTGSGIAPEDLPNIFKRFYKGKNSSSSSVGIGLALSNMIITNQNGTVKAENNHGKGATFTIRFYHATV